ncbi:MAG: acyl-CoA/acyl-ACP dehydrogenase, partial [Chloroflexi bacterium]|nr:acyl-CoA/acyl-ACP dehydrogenase [Chloroflexota bacterium]
MDFSFSADEQAYQAEVRAFLDRELTPERRREGLDYTDQSWADETLDREFRQALTESGLMGYSLPLEYGGRGKPGAYNAILSYEMARARAPG